MSYWTDDRRLLIEQRRLNADQQRAAKRMREKKAKETETHKDGEP